VSELERLAEVGAAAPDQLEPRLDGLDRLHNHNLAPADRGRIVGSIAAMAAGTSART